MTLAYGSWADAEALVGLVVAELEGVDAVNRPMVRHLLESLEWDFPPGLDDEAARAAGYEASVAPRSSYMTFGMPAYWTPGESSLTEGALAPFAYGAVPCPGPHMFALETTVEFPGVLLHGDQLRSTWRLVALTRKRLAVGDGAFLEFEIIYRNQRDEVVVVEQTTVFRYESSSAPDPQGRGDER